jgi:hypothetical protein
MIGNFTIFLIMFILLIFKANIFVLSIHIKESIFFSTLMFFYPMFIPLSQFDGRIFLPQKYYKNL